MTTQDILNRLAKTPDRALELYYDGYDKTTCWCYVASDGVPTVYWNLLDQERIAESALLESMLKNGPGVHEIPVNGLLDVQRRRVRKEVTRMRTESAVLDKIEDAVNRNLWKNVVEPPGPEPRYARYLCGATVSDEDCYWLACEPNGHVSFLSVVGDVTFGDDTLCPSDTLVANVKYNLTELLANTCDVIVAGPFVEKI